MWNVECGMWNVEWGIGYEKWGIGNEKEWSAVISKKLGWSLCSTAKRRGLHVESERWKVRIFICQFLPSCWNY